MLVFMHYIYLNITGSGVCFVHNANSFQAHAQWWLNQNFDYSFSGHGHIEGLQVATEHRLNYVGFGENVTVEPGTMVVGPCIVRGKKKKGIMCFSTESHEVVANPLGGSLKIEHKYRIILKTGVPNKRF